MRNILKLSVAALALTYVGQAAAVPVFNPSNGHYYEFIPTIVTSGPAAIAAAAAATPIAGYDNYLVTITSMQENAFIGSNVTTFNSWLGGSDAAVEGVWRWVVGPENGQIFFGPGAPVGAYSLWSGGSPATNTANNFAATFGGNPSTWFDTGTNNLGYIVEYSLSAVAGVPEPGTWATMLAGFGLMGFALRNGERRRSKALRLRYN